MTTTQLGLFVVPSKNTKVRSSTGEPQKGLPIPAPRIDITQGQPLDTLVGLVSCIRSGAKGSAHLHNQRRTPFSGDNVEEINCFSVTSPPVPGYLPLKLRLTTLTVDLIIDEICADLRKSDLQNGTKPHGQMSIGQKFAVTCCSPI
ncbi:MAG TPA: hypothetical protein VKZ53_07400 [Candidatus Angelobacter sp.]|nr:hypothetical protein [Candidatus Angelobacter sp.]